LVTVAVAVAAQAAAAQPIAMAEAATNADLPQPMARVGLVEAVRLAAERHPQVALAASEVARSKAAAGITRAGLWPNADAAATLTRSDGERRIGDRVLESATAATVRATATVPTLVPKLRAKARPADDAACLAKGGLRDAESAVASAEDTVQSLQVEILFAAGRLP
jgi:outer membrane protein TolC